MLVEKLLLSKKWFVMLDFFKVIQKTKKAIFVKKTDLNIVSTYFVLKKLYKRS